MLSRLAAITLLGMLAACRGGISESPPVHLVDDMDFQPKLKAQSASKFAGWTDGRGMRLPVAGTIARGSLKTTPEEILFASGKNPDGSPVKVNPLPKTRENLARGRERFDIHCAPCHERTGAGDGMVMQRAPTAFAVRPILATEQRLIDAPDGELFGVITNGKTTMPAYGHQVPESDRWAIVHYLRALQLHMKSKN